MTQAIIFDLWETLGTKNIGVSETLRKHFDIKKAYDYLRKYEESVQLKSWQTEDQMAMSFLARFGIKESSANIDYVKAVFSEGINNATLFDGIPELLMGLKHQHQKIGLLSNTTVFESAVLVKLNILDLFDAVVLSCDIGVLKPSPLAFNHTLKMLDVDAQESLFIDDGGANIKAAKTLGINALQFRGVETLKVEMKQFGINI